MIFLSIKLYFTLDLSLNILFARNVLLKAQLFTNTKLEPFSIPPGILKPHGLKFLKEGLNVSPVELGSGKGCLGSCHTLEELSNYEDK